jgi:hypothetical protein
MAFFFYLFLSILGICEWMLYPVIFEGEFELGLGGMLFGNSEEQIISREVQTWTRGF